MKILLLVRHAKSSWEDAAMADFDRPLNARGIKDADEMARRLAQRIDCPDAFIASPAKRTKATAQKFALVMKAVYPVIFETGLYLAPESFFGTFISSLSNNFTSVAIFSHNPGITHFANLLNTAVKTDNIPTCGIFAVTAATDDWANFQEVKKELLFYDYPKLQG